MKFFSIIGLLQDIEYSFLCYTVGPYYLSILYIVFVSANPKLLIYPSPPFSLVIIILFSVSVISLLRFFLTGIIF